LEIQAYMKIGHCFNQAQTEKELYILV